MSADPLLLEIGCEEIPARMIRAAADDLARRLVLILDHAALTHGAAQAWGGSRRLACAWSRFVGGRTIARISCSARRPASRWPRTAR